MIILSFFRYILILDIFWVDFNCVIPTLIVRFGKKKSGFGPSPTPFVTGSGYPLLGTEVTKN